MHELSLISSIFDIIIDVAKKNRVNRITKVVLKIGKLRQVVPSMMKHAFAITAKGTIAEDAALDVTSIPIKMLCNSCGDQFIVDEHIFLCPKCDSSQLEMIQGDELIVESIEGEQR